jgi:hypothetical protein
MLEWKRAASGREGYRPKKTVREAIARATELREVARVASGQGQSSVYPEFGFFSCREVDQDIQGRLASVRRFQIRFPSRSRWLGISEMPISGWHFLNVTSHWWVGVEPDLKGECRVTQRSIWGVLLARRHQRVSPTSSLASHISVSRRR